MAGTRLVLILSGGVSLGTYLAGALTEIFWALRNVNGDRAPTDDRRRDVRVEVIAGASAGALSGALFARALTASPSAVGDLHRAWVDDISIQALLEGGDGPALGVLSDRQIAALADRLLVPPADYRDWQPFCASPLRVAVTLTNLGGVRYRIRYANRNGSDTFFSTRIHSDAFEVALDNPPSGNGPADAAPWTALRDAALASGAFPGAFPPRRLARDLDDYAPARFASSIASPASMWFADGGLLDNEPVGLAKRMVEQNPEHRRLDYRYVLIDPFIDAPLHGRNERIPPGPDTLVDVLSSVAGAVLGQSSAKDWIRANKVNWRLTEEREFIVHRLRPMFDAVRERAPVAAEALASGLAAQARAIAAEAKRGMNGSDKPHEAEVHAYLRANHERIEGDPRYAEALEGLEGSMRKALRAAIFIVESAAGLRDKEPMPLYLIAPRGRGEHPLAGDFLHNFGGFFRREWRRHDFLCGRRDARAVLTEELRDDDGRPLFDYPTESGVVYDPAPVSAGPDDLTARERRTLRTFLKRRLTPVVSSPLPWYLKPFRGALAGRAADALMETAGIHG